MAGSDVERVSRNGLGSWVLVEEDIPKDETFNLAAEEIAENLAFPRDEIEADA
jgi:hypothetical protein